MTAKTITRRARAKINLCLHVTGQRADGYHLLDSLVCFADICDVVTVAPAETLTLTVDGPLSAGVPTDRSNLVMKAAALFGHASGAQIALTKNLPNAAGIGGGSADAAAALRALSELWEVAIPEDVVSLGADVPVCLAPMALRMRGVGDELSPVSPLPPLWAVMVNPCVALETPPVFKALKNKVNSNLVEMPECADAAAFAAWCATQRNDLQAPAIGLAPVIEEVLDALSPSLFASMSGSGATCFGLCESAEKADTLAAQVRENHPEWWVVSTTFS